MGYSLSIGEATIEEIESDFPGTKIMPRVVAELQARDDAPAFPEDDLSAFNNTRHPSYSTWSDFASAAGITGTMDELMPEHPCAVQIGKHHVEAIENALASYEDAHPDAEPGFMDGQDHTLARLIWLDFWVRTAFQTCRVPVFANT